jgi:hypothetical protein
MLLTSTGVISRSQHQEESVLLLGTIEQLNKNSAGLIAEVVKLIQESKQLTARVKSLENRHETSRRGNRPHTTLHYSRDNRTIRFKNFFVHPIVRPHSRGRYETWRLWGR